MSRIKGIICLGAGESQLPIINTIKKMGYHAIVIDKNPDAIGFKYADKKINLSTFDYELVLKALSKSNDSYEYLGLIARVTGPALKTAFLISEKFKVTGISKDLADLSMKKSELRSFCKKNNLLSPKGLKVNTMDYRDYIIHYLV
jgi:hypothetical protein